MMIENNYLPLNDSAGVPNGLRLHYATAGDARLPVMVFLHGFPQAWFVWETLMRHYSTRYYCVAPDLRGFNLSSKPVGVKQYAAKMIVADVLQLIAHINRQTNSPDTPDTPVTLVAHDWGGAIAWNIAVQHPQVLKKLVAINSPHPIPFARDMRPGGAQVAASSYMDWLAQPGSEAALGKDNYALLEGFFGGMGQGGAAWYTPSLQTRYHTMWGNPSDSAEQADVHPLTGCVNYYRATPLTPAKVAAHDIVLKPADWRVTVPTCVVWGEQDLALPVNLLDGLEDCIPDLTVRRVPQGNHWLIDAHPQAVIEAIGDFV
jgi:epoxide hydrolase 4